MKKRIIPLVLAVMLMLSLSANAANSIIKSVSTPLLSISGGKATCSATISFPGKQIDATMELWCGNVRLKSWEESGRSRIYISGEYDGVQRGKTYTVKVYGTADGSYFSVTPKSKTA